ncbi:MAG: peptidoglycan DD-metalloendopeptidase family protein, partial [Ruthenibacterium sp.]
RSGQQSEYARLHLGRALRHAGALAAAGVLLLLRTVMRPVGMLFSGIFRDLSAPFIQFWRGISHMLDAMRSASKQGENSLLVGADYFKRGFAAYRHLGATALSYLLPLSAATVLCLTAWSVLRTPYSLAVTYNNKLLGYVENETVWEEAEHRVLSRIQAVNASDSFDARPVFNVVSVDVAARTTAGDLTDNIIAESSDKIKEATGLYVGNTLVGVCTDDAAVQQMLDTTLAAAQPTDDPAARVAFVNAISKDRGLYFTDSISNLAQLESTLQTNNWLQTKVLKTETYEAAIEFETIEEESDTIYKGSTRTKQRGVNGKRNVTDDVTYINGVEVERVNVSEEIIAEAKPKIVLVGTKQGGYGGSYTGPVTQGSGALGWPVPDYNYTTTEFVRGHRGLDICAAYGTTVFAADGGTVVEAGWHWSWGNYILIDHGNGITTRYAHNSQLLVGVGATVAKGTPISLIGSTGTSSGNHCHFEVTVNGGLVNPRSYIVQP